MESGGILENIVQNSMEIQGNCWKLLISYRSWAWLASTLTHVVTHDPVTSGAENGRYQSQSVTEWSYNFIVFFLCPHLYPSTAMAEQYNLF